MTQEAHSVEVDGREPRACPHCGEVCAYDGWGHVHSTGLGIGSCPGGVRALLHEKAGEVARLREALERVREVAVVQARFCHAVNRPDYGRSWLDVLATIERGSVDAPAPDEADR